MAKRNTGKAAESAFELFWKTQGKSAWVFRLADSGEVFGRNKGRLGNVRAQPSDFLIVFNGRTEFAEVKSSQDATAFRFSMLRKVPEAMALMITAAGGRYNVYVENLVTGVWYCIPYSLIQAARAQGQASLSWKFLKDYQWKPPILT